MEGQREARTLSASWTDVVPESLSDRDRLVVREAREEILATPLPVSRGPIGCLAALAMSLATAGSVAIAPWQLPVLILFGVTLGLGMALFTQGARLIPSAFAALLGTAETVLGPLWVWIAVDESPAPRTVAGGAIVLGSIIAYLLWQILHQRKLRRLAPPAL